MRIARPTTTHLLLASALLVTCTTAHALDLFKPFKNLFGADETVLWQAPGQFVKVVEQDRVRRDRRPAKNAHPANLTASQLGTVLASLKSESGGKAVSIFTQGQITLLAGKLEEGLSKAEPTQDVVFAIAGGQDGTAGERLTAGRVFVHGSRLNFIFGDVLGPGGGDADNISHFAVPHRAGKRGEYIDQDVVIATGTGIAHFAISDRPRTDWVLVDVPAVVAAWRGPPVLPAAAAVPAAVPGPAAPVAAPTGMAPAATAPVVTAPPITLEQQRLLEERRRMLEEMARLKKQVQEQEAAGGAAGPATETTPARTGATPGKSLEERLATLQELHEKKLITDEEYAAKRKELLKEL